MALLDHDDEMSPHALFWAVKLLQEHRDADVIYSDEDKLELDGGAQSPFLSRGGHPSIWNRACTPATSLFTGRPSSSIRGFRAGYEGSQDHDLMLRACRRTNAIHHIPELRKALRLRRAQTFWSAVVEGAHKGQFRVKYPVNVAEKVSIIIPTQQDANP